MKSSSISVVINGEKVEAWVEDVENNTPTLVINGWCVAVVETDGRLYRCEYLGNSGFLKTVGDGKIELSN